MRQFIATYNRVKDLKGDELLWGDEVEYGIFVLDEQNKQIRLSLRAKEVRVLTFAWTDWRCLRSLGAGRGGAGRVTRLLR